MSDTLKDTIELCANIVTILAFFWAIYEFYIKRSFTIKAKATPSLLDKSTELSFDFEVINFSEQSLGRIASIGVWIKRWNSWGQFWGITLQDVGYKEMTKFSQDIYPFVESAVVQCSKEQTWFDKLFKPKLLISLKTYMGEELKIKIDPFNQKDIDTKLEQLFNKYKNTSMN